MSIHLHRDMESVQRRILSLASAVEQAVEKAIRALFDRDTQVAQQLMDGDTAIDLEENEIEEECLKILALHQPVAVDLRRVAAIMKINTDLERMADLAANIAIETLGGNNPNAADSHGTGTSGVVAAVWGNPHDLDGVGEERRLELARGELDEEAAWR